MRKIEKFLRIIVIEMKWHQNNFSMVNFEDNTILPLSLVLICTTFQGADNTSTSSLNDFLRILGVKYELIFKTWQWFLGERYGCDNTLFPI